jgi:hypothetical protein
MAITKRYRAKHYERMYAALMISFCSKKRQVSALNQSPGLPIALHLPRSAKPLSQSDIFVRIRKRASGSMDKRQISTPSIPNTPSIATRSPPSACCRGVCDAISAGTGTAEAFALPLGSARSIKYHAAPHR